MTLNQKNPRDIRDAAIMMLLRHADASLKDTRLKVFDLDQTTLSEINAFGANNAVVHATISRRLLFVIYREP